MKRFWFCNILLLVIACFPAHAMGNEVSMEEKAEATVPITSTQSPPEGNTTFLDGVTWCVAHPLAPQNELQIALDWACGAGKADCSPILAGGPCYQPVSVVSHASYAFNMYYQQNGNNDIACNFGGTATLTNKDPSYGRCLYAASRPMAIRAATTRVNAPVRLISLLLLLLVLTIRFKL